MIKFGESVVLFRSSSTHKKVGLGSLRNGGGRGGKEEATEFNQEKGRGPWGHMMCCCSYVEGMCHSHQELGAPDAAAHALLSHTYFPFSPPLSFKRTPPQYAKTAAAEFSDIICVNVRNFFLPLPTNRMDTFSALYLFHFPLICQSETSPLTFRASGNI